MSFAFLGSLIVLLGLWSASFFGGKLDKNWIIDAY